MAGLRLRDTIVDSDYASCPVGGEWWKCEDVNYPTFIGCCSSNPCSGQMCPDDNLFPMGFGAVTSPVPDYPNHSCPYGGLWYTCALNTVTFQGCCESNPCNGEGCPAADLKAAAVHTIEVAGGSTFTVPATVETAAPTSASASTTTTGSAAGSTSSSSASSDGGSSTSTGAIAGGAAAGGIALTALIVLAIWFYKRRKGRSQNKPIPRSEMSGESKYQYFDNGHSRTDSSTLPLYTGTSSQFSSPRIPFSPAPTYMSMTLGQSEPMPPQEADGQALTEEEFTRRLRSRVPVNSTDGPVELSSLRFSTVDLEAEANNPLLEPMPQPQSQYSTEPDRSTRLRSSPAMGDLRAIASRSPSRNPARNNDLG